MAFEDKDEESSISMNMSGRSVKAISIQALSANYFVVLDSIGDVHLLCLSYSVQGFDKPCLMKRLSQTMKVLKLAVFHDVSTDGSHTVHLMTVSNMDTSFDKTEKKDTKEKLIQTSVTRAIFTSEKIQDIAPLSANAILILGQDSIGVFNNRCIKGTLLISCKVMDVYELYGAIFLLGAEYVCLCNFLILLDVSLLKMISKVLILGLQFSFVCKFPVDGCNLYSEPFNTARIEMLSK
ncbi:UNVERIFIED_CONTAM: hypothetical protein Sradi_3114300 [Sesamum radiatum]|uniref:Uncharacterized protein n=1 Tax=Sesamum radiatum TaxID=300843 RepID=A0AAW2RDP4_SESRA